jgi:TatD DNase family protein
MISAGLIDTHCHLDYDYAPKTEADLVREAMNAGVTHLVTIAAEPGSLDRVPAISERYPNVFHTVGIHPHEAIDFKDEYVDKLTNLAAHPKCRAIGEIGLDYHYDHSPRGVQLRVLEQQLEIALATRQPIVIHSREGEQDLLPALKRYATRAQAPVPGIIHCFTGSREFGRACLELGFYVSFSGILTFKNAEDLRESAREFPLEQLLVETDSPYLAPIPNRGKKCEPAMVRFTAEKLAELKGLPIEEIARVTSANARRVFRIE